VLIPLCTSNAVWNRSCNHVPLQLTNQEVPLSMKSLRFFALTALLFTLAPAVFAAEFGVRAGRYSESEQDFVGAEMLFDLGAVNINPNLEYALDDDVTTGTANLDLTVDVGQFARVRPFLGAGVGLLYVDDDFGDNTTEPLLNVLGGVAFDLDFLKPYAQVKYFRIIEGDNGNDDELALTVGLRF